jgi:hypothetical protein
MSFSLLIILVQTLIMYFLLDIYFQRGEFSIESSGGTALWKIVIGPIIGAVVSTLIWLLTYRKDRKKDQRDKQTLNLQRVGYLRHLSKSALHSLSPQVTYITEFATEIGKNPYEVGMLKMSIFSDLNRIVNKLDLEQHYHSYLIFCGSADKNGEKFRKLIAAFDYANKQVEEIPVVMESAKSYYYERVKSYQQKSDIVENHVLSLIQRNLTSEAIFFKQLSNLRKSFGELRAKSNVSNGLEFHHDNYIQELKKLCGEFVKEDIVLIQILALTKEMSLLVNEIKGNNLEFGKAMAAIGRKLNIVVCRLPSNFEWLKEK